MASTPDSGSSSYASVSDLTDRYDVRTVTQLASDTDVPVASGSLSSSARVLAALADASGLVESAVTVGRQYRIEDLAALTGNGLAYLKRLTADLAIGLLILARPSANMELPRAFEHAEEALSLLRQGERVLGLLEQKLAGQLGDHKETAREVEDRRGVVAEAQRFFSRRNNRLGL